MAMLLKEIRVIQQKIIKMPLIIWDIQTFTEKVLKFNDV
jgi:hypothetical protein